MTDSFNAKQRTASRYTQDDGESDVDLLPIGPLEAALNLPRQGRSLCFLVVADMDLQSASLLAEAALRELPKGGTLVDGILACGPFVTPQSLRPYLSPTAIDEYELGVGNGSSASVSASSASASASASAASLPRSLQNIPPELVFALEGLVTGCLSQLESISCRVIWVPSAFQDPSTLWSLSSSHKIKNHNCDHHHNQQHQQNATTWTDSSASSTSSGTSTSSILKQPGIRKRTTTASTGATTTPIDNSEFPPQNTNDMDPWDYGSEGEKRLTPNSRNIHCRSLPLAQGLSCCGLAMDERAAPAGRTNQNLRCEETEKQENTKEEFLPIRPVIRNLLDLSSSTNSSMVHQEDGNVHHFQIAPAIIVATTTSLTAENGTPSSSPASDQVMCFQSEPRIVLHIHATSSWNEEREKPRLANKVLHPGSLREYGEYCLVHMEVVPDDENKHGVEGNTSSSLPSLLRWQVSGVDFRYIGDNAH